MQEQLDHREAVIEDAELLGDECPRCGGSGSIEIMGDGDNFEWDVVGYKPCPDCQFED